MVHYIDDWVFFCKPEQHMKLVAQILEDIKNSGFVMNIVKSVGLDSPLYRFDWIGHTIDLAGNSVSIMKHHEDHILELCRNLVEKGVGSSIKAIHLMRVSGKLASGWNVIRRETTFYTAHTARVAHSVRRKHHFVKLTMGVIRELNFWLTNLSQLNGKPLWTIAKPTAFDTRIRVDAGEPGWGGHAEVVCGRVPEQQPEANVAWEKNEKNTFFHMARIYGTVRNTPGLRRFYRGDERPRVCRCA